LRRRALLSLERLPSTPEATEVVTTIVDEPSLLGAHDTVDRTVCDDLDEQR
jgi:hypothetical protein